METMTVKASIVCPTSVFGASPLLLASFASNQLCMAKLASKHRTSNICLPTSKNLFDLNQKHFCLPKCKLCLPNMKCLKKMVVAKRASKDRKLWLSHVRQTMLVSFARPLETFGLQFWLCISKFYNCTKFHYHHVAGEKLSMIKISTFSVSDHLKTDRLN